jgi:hypothetical protein
MRIDHDHGNTYKITNEIWKVDIENYYDTVLNFETYPPPGWFPQAGDKYVLCEDTKFWSKTEAPAFITVKELLEDADFMMMNTNAVQIKIAESVRTLTSSTNYPNAVIKYIPSLFLGISSNITNITDHSGTAFNPGPANLQPVAGKLYIPRQFAPLNNAGEDIFENAIRSNLPGHTIKFVDDWDVYHSHEGEIHCGSNVIRTPINNWWEKLPDLPKNP